MFLTDKYMYAILAPDYLSMIINENGLDEKNGAKLKQIRQDDNCTVVNKF
jgi:hypothetical protein